MRAWMKPVAAGVVAAGVLMWSGFGALAQQARTISVPSDAKTVVYVDVTALKKTKIGAAIFKMAREQATEALAEMAKEQAAKGGDAEETPDIEKVNEVLGFDPFEDIRGLMVAVTDYENPEAGLTMIVELGQTSGNLEGLVVTAPGYESSTYGKYQIHSISPDEKHRGYAAIHTDGSGRKRIVASTNQGAVERLLDELDGKTAAGGAGMRTVTLGGGGGTFVNVDVSQLPIEEMGDGPQSNIAKLVKGVAVTVGEADENYLVDVTLTTLDDAKAEQLRQLAQGAMAAMQLAEGTEEGQDEDFKQVMEFAKGLSIDVEGNRFHLSLKAPTAKVNALIREESDLPIE